MRHATRPWALVLGVLLALAWSSAALAQSRSKGGRGGRAGPAAKKDDGHESKKADKQSSRKQQAQPKAAPAPAHQPRRPPAYQPPRTRQPGPTRAPAYQPPRGQQPRAPAYRQPRAPAYQQPGAPRHPAPAARTAPAPAYRSPADASRRPPVSMTGRSPVVRDGGAANRIEAPISRVPAVPPLVRRGGKTFTQTASKSGNRIVVTRKSAGPAATNSPYSHGSHSSGHHGGQHSTTTVRHYHYHYWGYGYYYCYLGYWSYYPWFWSFYFAPFPSPWDYHHWWWVGAPWYRYWGWYYTPYAVYVAPSYWVTDYALARMLEAEYARGWADGQAAAGTPISEPVKEQIRVQVDDVARTFQASEALLLENALADPDYLFIVDTPLSVTTDSGGTCSLTGGDIVRRAPGPESALPVTAMAVVTSKSEECPAGSVISISHSDLQEMLNTFGQTVDDGLNELQRQQEQEEADGDR